MFARRHPFLFFFICICACISITFIGSITMVSVGAGIVGSRLAPQKALHSSGNIGIVEVQGVIVSSKKTIENIQAFRDDDAIKAIVVRIDSPGGGIGPSQEIYREIIKTRQKKKVIASMGSVAASGGYYIAAACDGIIANPGTITGSIGVIMEYANVIEIARKIGITPVVIKSGEFKDVGSPLRDMTDKEKEFMQGLVDELYHQFVSDVAKARKMDVTVLTELSDGRVYTGQKALELKLLDRLGNLGDAVHWAGALAHISGELVPVYPREDKMTFIKRLADTLFKDIHITSTVTDNLRYIIN